MSHQTTFTDAAAVQAWDAWFRWREGSALHDRTIDATWERVVDAIGRMEGGEAARWSQKWRNGLSRWQWLPDETFLRDAGTGAPPRLHGPVSATLILNAFVRPLAFGATRRELDTQAITDTAMLVLRFLDDALLESPGLQSGLRIGVLGLADALEALGFEYDSPMALQAADAMGAALAAGALAAAIDLARERGGRAPDRSRLEFLASRGLPQSLVENALRWGVRHEVRTAIAPVPRLALLANNSSDAINPQVPRRGTAKTSATAPGSPGLPSLRAQLGIRAAIQPWIDEPIDYPLAIVGAEEASGTLAQFVSDPFEAVTALHQERRGQQRTASSEADPRRKKRTSP